MKKLIERHIKLSLLICVFYLSGCTSAEEGAYSPTLKVLPSEFINESELVIHLPKVHPKNLTIRNPDKAWFMIQSIEEGIKFMPESQFSSASHLRINPRKLTGFTWKEGNKVEGLVFKKEGEYLIYMADNLETEPENTFSLQITVTKRKP